METGIMTPDSLDDIPGVPPGLQEAAPRREDAEDFKNFKAWTEDKFKKMERGINDLETRLAEKLNQVDKGLNLFEPLRKDIGFFASIKSYVNREEVETTLSAIERLMQENKNGAEADKQTSVAKLEQPTKQTEQALVKVDGHFTQLSALEQDFKKHLEVNFTAVEEECKTVWGILDEVTAAANKSSEANFTTMQMQQTQMHRELLSNKSASDMQNTINLKHVTDIKNEISQIQAGMNNMREHVGGLTANSSQSHQEICLAQIHSRVEAIELKITTWESMNTSASYVPKHDLNGVWPITGNTTTGGGATDAGTNAGEPNGWNGGFGGNRRGQMEATGEAMGQEGQEG